MRKEKDENEKMVVNAIASAFSLRSECEEAA